MSSFRFLLYSAEVVLFLLAQGCDCGSAVSRKCSTDTDCPDCQTCQTGECRPAEEICDDNMDNDCDGETDEGCEDLCEGVVCFSPPPRECLDDTTLKFFNLPGYCVDGECRYSSTEYACEQGCENDHCVENHCIGLYCNDENPCTDDGCDPSSGCTNVPNSDSCEDGDLCTDDDVCVDGSCQPGDAIDCDDGIDCTEDSCDSSVGCVNNPVDSECDDDNPCTDDICDPSIGCVNTSNSDTCDDGNTCTMDDLCADGICRGVPLDRDGDGFVPFYCWGEDCDDADFLTNPDAEELCNGKDNNCDGLVDMIGSDLCNYEAFCGNGELVFCEDVPGPTTAPVVIDENTVWCSSNSPFLLEDSLVVLGGAVLVIGPCTEIRASDGVYFNVRGQLDVAGHPEQPILFTSASPLPGRGSWGGIQAQEQTDAKVRLYSADVEYGVNGFKFDQCGTECVVSIEKCTFSHNEYAVQGYPWECDDGVEILDSTFLDNTCGSDSGCKTFVGCTFTGNDCGVCTGFNVSLYDCNVSNNVVGLECGRGSVVNCIIENNSEAGITSILEGPALTGNMITNNKIGIVANYYDGNSNVSPAHQNIICDNSEYDIQMDTPYDLDATNNWWCTTDPDIISSRVFDVYDDASMGRVLFEPFLEEEP